MTAIAEYSVLTCPHCGTRMRERMPTDACVVFHECLGCKTMLRPRAGDCCVFCTYGSVPCPPIQVARTAGVSVPCNCN